MFNCHSTGQHDCKTRALAGTVTLGGDGAVMEPDEVLHNSQAQSQAAIGLQTRNMALPEPFEDVR